MVSLIAVSYTHLRAHENEADLVCRLLLEKKFKTDLTFDSVDVWIDDKGYKLPPHLDDKRIKLHLQVYLSNNNEGTSLYNPQGELLYTFPFKVNYGYALYNGAYSYHGVEEVEEDGRTSLYAVSYTHLTLPTTPYV